MPQFPMSSLDRKVDELGTEEQIQTEDDARAYVQALSDKLGFEKKGLQQLSDLKLRLAHAEYMSVRNPSERIPEAHVADTFNKLMDEWRMPDWTRIDDVVEMHAFRVVMSHIANPKSASRLPDGNIANTCRPVEAVYLIWLLNSQISILPALREKLRVPGWLEAASRNVQMEKPPALQADTRSPDDAKRKLECRARRSKYFSRYSTEEATTRIVRILAVLNPE